jgi:hypothetical protein
MVLFNRVYSMLKRTKFVPQKMYRKSLHTDCDKCIEKIKLQNKTDIYEILFYITLIANGSIWTLVVITTDMNKRSHQ